MVDTGDLPLLGEAFAVELANSRYRTDREDLDFLADDVAVRGWFAHAPTAAGIAVPETLPAAATATLCAVRDATRQLLGELADHRPPSPVAAEVLHGASRRAAAHVALDLATGGSPAWSLHHEGSEHDVLVATVATRCVLFLGGADAARVRRCARPGCPLLFVQRHRARRFCHDSCAHSVRQARYYRSTAQRGRRAP